MEEKIEQIVKVNILSLLKIVNVSSVIGDKIEIPSSNKLSTNDKSNSSVLL